MLAEAALGIYLTALQVARINYVMGEANHGLAIRSAAIFLVESSAGTDKKHRDKSSHGWFQLQIPTACFISGKHPCTISAKELETNTQLNTKLGLAYIQYCAESFPESEARQIACHRWGVPKTKVMSPAKLNKLQQKGGYVWRVLRAEKQLAQVRVSHE